MTLNSTLVLLIANNLEAGGRYMMKKIVCSLLIFTLFPGMLISVKLLYASEVKLVTRINKSAGVLEEIMRIPEKRIPEGLMRNCEAVAIFPSVVKAGFIVGGRGGKGIVVARDEMSRKWGAPSFYSIGGGSLGFQFGVQVIDVILIVPTRSVLNSLVQDRVALGVDAAVAAGPVGRNVEASTDILLKGGILSYARTRGLFAGVSLKGTLLRPDYNANKLYYGRYISAERILLSGKVKPPDSANTLLNILIKYSVKD